MALDITKIIQDNIQESCYNKVVVPKTQIVIHHTGSSGDARNVITGFRNRTDKVCTPFVIAGNVSSSGGFKDGDIYQAYSSKFWSYHLGLSAPDFSAIGLPYKDLNSTSISIELCNWGYLTKDAGGNYMNYMNKIVPSDEVEAFDVPYKGYNFYHKYTDSQINSLRDLLLYLCKAYNITTTYHVGMFEVSKDAMSGMSGIWTHTSYRKNGKWDCSPQKNLIKMLQTLNQNV